MEKVWRKLRQELLQQHDYQDDWSGLQTEVERRLEQAQQDPDGLRPHSVLRRRRRRNAVQSPNKMSKIINPHPAKKRVRLRFWPRRLS
jgi:hypothetical protein